MDEDGDFTVDGDGPARLDSPVHAGRKPDERGRATVDEPADDVLDTHAR
ncbi:MULTISPECIES: hypothetical protein [Streptomyces]|nr:MULTISPECIES: hypothetical protein [Streptomyces]MDX2551966.1 hypothetical protein [Streptomyces stelliscabiei]MDX2609666.1 hypothetical protein [Streptomyces stelliscabiei]MDX2636884.1 hypothetical protein [Streptomyces stelliscabiei]MDX2660301.1 hypothetical protein [Streptomyces stelliscabiei]MDX2710666.1 hypothetical protein [Streptomyces stelliscabiei]